MNALDSTMSEAELRKMMNEYHDKWIECQNKLIRIKEAFGRHITDSNGKIAIETNDLGKDALQAIYDSL